MNEMSFFLHLFFIQEIFYVDQPYKRNLRLIFPFRAGNWTIPYMTPIFPQTNGTTKTTHEQKIISKIMFLLLFHSYFLCQCCFYCTIGFGENGGHVREWFNFRHKTGRLSGGSSYRFKPHKISLE